MQKGDAVDACVGNVEIGSAMKVPGGSMTAAKRKKLARVRPKTELRVRAESQLAAREAGRPPRSAQDAVRLLHELEVHQIELELQNEELLRARQDTEACLSRFAELFDFAPIGYVVLDASGTVREANLALGRLLDTPRGELVGRRFERFVEMRHRNKFIDLLARVMEDERDQAAREITDLLIVSARGDQHHVHVFASHRTQVEACALVAITDVTELRRAESALRDENNRKDDFIAALSHELRNPLAPMRSSLSVLERVAPSGEQGRKAMLVLNRQIQHLVHLIDDLLDVTRIARGKVRLVRERLELGALLRRTLEDHRADFDARAISLVERLAETPVWVDGDATRLVQVVGNLLANAVKFTPRGGRVEVVERIDGKWAVVSVRDNGAGIPPEIRDVVFEPFVQAPQALDRPSGGLGLGLAMVKGLVELHGGTVVVNSAGLGKGSEFTIRLPMTSAPTARPPAMDALSSRRSRRVLVVDDTIDAADSLAELLRLEGHVVRVAYDGPSALTIARDFHPEIVFCDIGLPEVDGYQLARAMRADDTLRDVQLVALSGYTRSEDRQRSAAAGFDCHLAKPPELETIERVIAERPAHGSFVGMNTKRERDDMRR